MKPPGRIAAKFPVPIGKDEGLSDLSMQAQLFALRLRGTDGVVRNRTGGRGRGILGGF